MSLISLASFPNSRVKPRAATSEAATFRKTINGVGEASLLLPDGGVVTANGNTLLFDADEDRTYIELRNTSTDTDLVYSYNDLPDLEQKIGQDGGFLLPAGASISLEAKTAIYAKSTTGARLEVHIDQGRG
jgi:hypothetical protein